MSSKPKTAHPFTKVVPEFDQAIRKLVDVPPEKVRDRESETRTPRTAPVSRKKR